MAKVADFGLSTRLYASELRESLKTRAVENPTWLVTLNELSMLIIDRRHRNLFESRFTGSGSIRRTTVRHAKRRLLVWHHIVGAVGAAAPLQRVQFPLSVQSRASGARRRSSNAADVVLVTVRFGIFFLFVLFVYEIR